MANEYQLRSCRELADPGFLQHDFQFVWSDEPLQENPYFSKHKDEIVARVPTGSLRSACSVRIGDVQYRIEANSENFGICMVVKAENGLVSFVVLCTSGRGG
jgi:hypothetical protein